MWNLLIKSQPKNLNVESVSPILSLNAILCYFGKILNYKTLCKQGLKNEDTFWVHTKIEIITEKYVWMLWDKSTRDGQI